ncbi:MAG TPA: LptF/LptG family permease [Candidatus Ozemobacteraceae bacterium]|nr:LptF/LptG family permease [Candidatus Ozemobacteraceae bacterium]
MLKTIDRYIFSELLQPFLFGLAFFVTIWLIDLMMELINLVFTKGVPPSVVFLFFIYNLPPTLVISFPMALLLGTLVAFGRLSSDSEVIAMKAGGYSFTRIAAPAVISGLAITAITFMFNEKVVPVANDKFSKLFRREVTLKRPLPKIAANRFFEAGPGRKFFVREFDKPTRDMFGVIMYEGQPKNYPRVIEATKARIDDGKCIFWDGRISDIRSSGSDYHYTYFDTLDYPIDTHYVNPDDVPDNKDPRRMNISELYTYIKDLQEKGLSGKALKQNWIEFWTKTSIPFASLIFALLGAPLGTQTSRSGTSIGIGMSVVIIFLYYVFFAAGKAFATGGYVSPFVGVWLPNFVIGSIGVWLIMRSKA